MFSEFCTDVFYRNGREVQAQAFLCLQNQHDYPFIAATDFTERLNSSRYHATPYVMIVQYAPQFV